MPVKRRAAKVRQPIDDGKMEDQFYGPGTCVFNGVEYLGPYGDPLWRDADATIRSEVIEAMRADWEREAPRVIAAWSARTPHDLWCAKHHYGDRTEPWALAQFGDPRNGT